jgi:hypothetical protein
VRDRKPSSFSAAAIFLMLKPDARSWCILNNKARSAGSMVNVPEVFL